MQTREDGSEALPLQQRRTEVPAAQGPFSGVADRRLLTLAAVVLAAWCWAIYLPVLEHEFLEYDDAGYIVQNADLHDGLTLELVRNAFTNVYLSNWHPLTMLSWGMDVSLFGMHSGAMHAVNVMFHVLNVVLLLALSYRLTGSALIAAFVAGLFAVHPQHVEPVAWLASRKDVLSTAFLLAGLHFYVGYARQGSWLSYALMLLALALGLMAKQMLVTAPFLLMLLDYWPLKRMAKRSDVMRCVIEKVPLFVLCAAMALAVLWAQTTGGSVTSGTLSIADRVTNVIMAYVHVLSDTFVPVGLAAFYPRWMDVDLVQTGLALTALAFVTVSVVIVRRQAPELLFGWAWFVVCLLPVSGLIPLGAAVTADRYAYVPHIGLFIAIGALAGRIPLPTSARGGAAVVILAAYSVISAWYVPYFKNDITLFERVLSVTQPHVVSLTNLGNGYRVRGWYDEALNRYRQALAIAPGHVSLLHNIGVAEARRGSVYDARETFERLVKLRPADEVAQANLESMMNAVNTVDADLDTLHASAQDNPEDLELRQQLLWKYVEAGLTDRALSLYDDGLDDPGLVAAAALRTGRNSEAISLYRKAIDKQPITPELQFAFVRALNQAGRRAEAQARLSQLIATFPRYELAVQYRSDLGW